MHASVAADCELSAAHVTDCDGAAGIAVDANRRGESAAIIAGPDVAEISVFGIAREIKEVNNAILLDDLWLDAAIGNTDVTDRRSGTHRRQRENREYQEPFLFPHLSCSI